MKKRCTIKTIAQKLGVAPSTVSRAFQPESRISDVQRALILKTAKEMNYVPNHAASRLVQKEVHIGILLQNAYPPGQQQILSGIEEAYRTFSDYKVGYQIEFFDGREDSPEECAAVFRKFADYDGIIVAGICSRHMKAELEKYKAKGKSVVLLQSGPDYDGYLFRSVPDAETAARMAAELLALCLHGYGNPDFRVADHPRSRVLLITGIQTMSVHAQGKSAFLDECKKLDLEVAGIYDMQDNEAVLEELIRTTLTPAFLRGTDGIYITSGLCLPLCRYLEEIGEGGRIAVVATDSFPELHPFILRQTVNASVYQNFFKQAWDAYEYLVKYLISGAKPPKILSPRPEFVLRSNLAFYDGP